MGSQSLEVSESDFLKQAEDMLPKKSFELVKRAYDVASNAHKDQKRLSGQPYIIHPVNVAYIIMVDLFAVDSMIAAGLLHDVVEDTTFNREMMIKEFGKDIADMVSGVTKVSKIKNQSKEFIAAENIRRMVMASTKDPRVIQIKIADKTHNMRTIGFQPEEKQKRIAKEVFTVYAPLAGRLGIYKIKSELEDLAFQVIYPEEYQKVKQLVSEKKSERDQHIEIIQKKLEKWLEDGNVEAKIEGRAKHFYSIHKKLTEKEKDVKEIYDLRAVRIITDHVRDCYAVLGIVHTNFTPIPGRFKDYIATPKTNLYQSLHTTVISYDGKPLEIQIRTQDMNRIAEYGIAAHWSYKEGKESKAPFEDKMIARWQERLRTLADNADNADPNEFISDLTGELHEDEVFVFTPKGDLFEFPKGSTVLDFAFRVHTDVGLHTKAAKINGKIVSIRTEIHSGDQIEIVTDKNSKPSPLWLRILKTPSARQKVRQYFRKISEELGKEYVTSSKSNIAVNDKDYSEIQKGDKPEKKKPSKKKEISVVVGGFKDILVRLSNCCSPLPGDEIIGFITRGRGVSVHKKDCELAKKQTDKKRLVNVRWDGFHKPVPVRIEVKAYDRPRIYLEIVESISKTDTNILEAGASSAGHGTLLARFLIEIEHHSQLDEILDNIKSIQNIIHVERVKTK